MKLWTEQYRPNTLNGYVFRDQTQKEQIQGWGQSGSIPHLLFSGAPGTGKTTLAKILFNELNIDPYDILEINASRENSVDTIREKISEEQKNYENKPKIFIQINIGNEPQKSGIDKNKLAEFYNECINLDLDIVGTMCLPPIDNDPGIYFLEMKKITKILNLKDFQWFLDNQFNKFVSTIL